MYVHVDVLANGQHYHNVKKLMNFYFKPLDKAHNLGMPCAVSTAPAQDHCK